MDGENDKSIIEMLKNSPEAIIAAMARDIHYLTKAVDTMNKTLEHMDDNYVKQQELNDLKKDRDETRKEMQIDIDSRLKIETFVTWQKEVFDPIKKTLVNLNWLLISAFFVALLALIFKK